MRGLKIFYVAGPGNVVGTYRWHLKGEHDPGQVSVTYSGQFFDVCRELGLRAKVVTTYHDGDRIAAEGIEVENWPSPWMRRGGARYHLGSLIYHLRLMAAIVASRARFVVYFDQGHWFLLAPIRLLGVRVVPTLHNRLWIGERPRRGVRGLITRLNAWYFRRCSAGVMCVSREIAEEVRQLAGDALTIRVFSPSYVPGTFVAVPPPDEGPRRVLYVGRVEAAKGVLDLVDVAATLRDRGREDLVFEICGDGEALDEMRRRVRSRGLDDWFELRGHVGREGLPEAFRNSFVVVAPTRVEFAEGFNKVVAEAVLAGRPVVTSLVCPAAAELGEAVVLARPDSAVDYADAVESLVDDPARYDEAVRAGEEHRRRFLDPDAGWGACLKDFLLDALPELGAGGDATEREAPPR